VERVDHFVYLGLEIAAKETCATEIRRRIALAGTSFAKFDKILWKSQDVSLETKLIVFNASVILVLQYGCKSWNAPNHMQEERLNAFENRCLRRILKVRWQDHVNTTNLRERASNQPFLSSILHKRLLKWAGHVYRMNEERYPKMVVKWRPQGKQPRGRLWKRWSDKVKEDLALVGELGLDIQDAAQDRERWRKIVW
uniref:Reverse transcriptase domain-containing protein n=1 Tax=Latimeria chalumnae TaxID=7897 RepID=H3B235_LATCH